MGTKYTSRTISGYNATPPADDGTETEANKGYWATIKTKLADPVKNYADDINTAMATYADFGPITKSAVYTTTTAEHLQTIECTGTFTLTLGAVATMGAGYTVTIKNTGTGIITVDGSGAETIDGQASVTLDPLQGITVQVDSTATEYLTIAQKEAQFPTPAITAGSANIYTVTTGETAYLTDKVYSAQINVTNTGASTIDFDSLGVKNIKMVDGSDPYAGALYAGQSVDFIYDGTNMVITSATPYLPALSVYEGAIQSGAVTQTKLGNASVGQAQLKAATASQSLSVVAGATGTINPSGGVYTMGWFLGGGGAGAWTLTNHGGTYVATVAATNNNASPQSMYLYSGYVQASPPYNLGNGDIALFITAKINKTTGEILATEVAPDPHWAYHGPHDLHPHYGKLQKAAGLWGVDVRSAITGDAVARADVASKLEQMKTICADPDLLCKALSYEFTMEEKNIDMNLIPHGFGPIGPDEMVVLVDPAGSITDQLGTLHDGMSDAQTGSISELLLDGYIQLGTTIDAITPKGVVAVSATWKNTG